MSDLAFLGMAIVFFLVAAAFARACQKLRGAADD
jgi:hypothetical protein